MSEKKQWRYETIKIYRKPIFKSLLLPGMLLLYPDGFQFCLVCVRALDNVLTTSTGIGLIAIKTHKPNRIEIHQDREEACQGGEAI